MPPSGRQSSRGAKARQADGQPARRGRPPKAAAAAASNSGPRKASASNQQARAAAKKARTVQDEDEDEDEDMEDEEDEGDKDDDDADDGDAGRDSVDGQDTNDDDDDDDEAGPPVIPEELVLRILQQHSHDKDLRITKNAGTVLSQYIDIFVKEAIARTANDKHRSILDVSLSDGQVCPNNNPNLSSAPGLTTLRIGSGKVRMADMTETCHPDGKVEALEKIAPQLLLDF